MAQRGTAEGGSQTRVQCQARGLALPQHREQQTLTVALPHVLHCDDLSLPAGDGLQLALVPVSDTIGATHLGGRGEM